MKSWLISRINAFLVCLQPKRDVTNHIAEVCEQMREEIRQEREHNDILH